MSEPQASANSPVTPRQHWSVLLRASADAAPGETKATPDETNAVPGETNRADAPIHAGTDALLAAIERAGAAREEVDYVQAAQAVFECLDTLEAQLDEQRYLAGHAAPAREDWWLYCILVRFDAIYYSLYKLNLRRLVDYPNLHNYLLDLHQQSPAPDSVDFDAIKRHYYRKDPLLNPKGVMPEGGVPYLYAPHDRAARFDRAGMLKDATEEDQHKRRIQGEWVRKQSRHRNFIRASPDAEYPAEPGRYHLYVANNCPWCHRVTLVRSLKQLQDLISLDTLYFRRDPERGWQFRPDLEGFAADSVYGHRFIADLYDQVGSTERSVPVLFDKKSETIVSNESADIVRMLNDAFIAYAPETLDLYPEPLRDEIDQLNAWIYNDINNGAYKAGFTSSQAAYERAYGRLFAAFEALDARLATRRFLTGEQLTEADVRLFPTAFRFDHVYYIRFKLNHRMLRDYRHLYRWLRDMVHWPGVAEASNLEHAKRGYFGRTGNNFIPLGPAFDFGPKPSEQELAAVRSAHSVSR